MQAWVAGYITAYNRQTPDTVSLVGGFDLNSAMSWLQNYCRAHPLSNLSGAMEALTVELYPGRYRTRENTGR